MFCWLLFEFIISFSLSFVHSLALQVDIPLRNCGSSEMDVAVLGKWEGLYRPYCTSVAYRLCLL